MPTHFPHNSRRVNAALPPRRYPVQWLALGAGLGFIAYAVGLGVHGVMEGASGSGWDAAAYVGFGVVACLASRGSATARGWLLWGGLLLLIATAVGVVGDRSPIQVGVAVAMITAAALVARGWPSR